MIIRTIAGQPCLPLLKAAATGGDLGTQLVRTLDGTLYAVETGPPSPLVIDVDGSSSSPMSLADARHVLDLWSTKALFTVTATDDLGDPVTLTGCRIITRPTFGKIASRTAVTYKFQLSTGVTAWT